MTKYREILRLLSLGISERKIAESCGVSRNTVSRIRKRADEIGLKWPLDASQTDKVLETRLYPKGTVDINSKRMPDYEYIRKELLKNGVTKKLLWTEYLEECRQSGENPLMYLCIPSSAITSSRMNRNGVPPCISPESRGN